MSTFSYFVRYKKCPPVMWLKWCTSVWWGTVEIMEIQVLLWKPHNNTSICLSFFVVNDNLPINIENPQMLWCIVYIFQHAYGNILNQSNSIIRKGLIKYSKTNGITIMKTHIDNVHLHLFAKRKIILSEKAITKVFGTYHSWQHGKKGVGRLVCKFFGGFKQTYTRILMKHNNFWKILCLIFSKVIGLFPPVKKIGYTC